MIQFLSKLKSILYKIGLLEIYKKMIEFKTTQNVNHAFLIQSNQSNWQIPPNQWMHDWLNHLLVGFTSAGMSELILYGYYQELTLGNG